MKLRTKDSFWLANEQDVIKYPPLTKNIKTEIVVVGGGITGAFISYALLNAGYKVILIDKGITGRASTAASSSMLQYEIDVHLYELAEMIGEKNAALCYKAGIEAIEYLKRLVAQLKIDCGIYNEAIIILITQCRRRKEIKKRVCNSP